MAYSIGRAAELLQVSPESLRRWEKQGFIPKPKRRPTDRREYSEGDITAIKEYLNKR